LNDARKNCPVDTGALKNSLKLETAKVTNTRADVKIDYDKKLKYGVFVELGTNGRAPNPFMRNAVDNNQDEINDAIVNAVKKAVK
jgi:HK97 gp10 family phage protein